MMKSMATMRGRVDNQVMLDFPSKLVMNILREMKLHNQKMHVQK